MLLPREQQRFDLQRHCNKQGAQHRACSSILTEVFGCLSPNENISPVSCRPHMLGLLHYLQAFCDTCGFELKRAVTDPSQPKLSKHGYADSDNAIVGLTSHQGLQSILESLFDASQKSDCVQAGSQQYKLLIRCKHGFLLLSSADPRFSPSTWSLELPFIGWLFQAAL